MHVYTYMYVLYLILLTATVIVTYAGPLLLKMPKVEALVCVLTESHVHKVVIVTILFETMVSVT